MEQTHLHMQILKNLSASGASPQSAFPNQSKVRGKGRGRGKGKLKQPKLDDSDGEREMEGNSLCDSRMAALLHASAKLDSDALSVYTFEVHVMPTCLGDDSQSIVRVQWSQSAMVCSQYYSRRVWALGTMTKGESGGVSFELDSPLHFMSGVELMQEIHSQAQKVVKDKTIRPCRISVPGCDSNSSFKKSRESR